jgi:predicted dinucleotide-binding enzyme
MKIAILGAGKLGVTLAQLALKAGYGVTIAGSGDPDKIRLSMRVLAPGAHVDSVANAAEGADIVILALPLSKFRNISSTLLKGKLVIDAMNYWWEVDGDLAEILTGGISSSEEVQRYFSDARVVKALNHMGYHDLFDYAAPERSQGRKAIAIAGDSPQDTEAVAQFVSNLGFEPYIAGTLADGKAFEPGGLIFGVSADIATVKHLLS